VYQSKQGLSKFLS